MLTIGLLHPLKSVKPLVKNLFQERYATRENWMDWFAKYHAYDNFVDTRSYSDVFKNSSLAVPGKDQSSQEYIASSVQLQHLFLISLFHV